MTGTKAHRFTTLDALRGVAALVVACDHLPNYTIPSLLPGTYLAVDFFFVLSGFVIADAYLNALETGMPAWRFLAIRLARFYPLYLLGIAIGAAMLAYISLANPTRGLVLPQSIVASLFFLPTPPVWSALPGLALPLDIPAWSLSWELFANAMLAALIWLKLWRGRLPLILALAGAAVVALGLAHGGLNVGGHSEEFWLGSARVLYPFFAGLFVHQLWRENRLRWSLPAPVGVLLLLAVLAISPPDSLRGAYDAAASLVLLPLIVASSTGAARTPILEPLGRASYGIYILHWPLVLIAIPLVRRLTGSELLAFGVAGSLTFMAAVVAIALVVDAVYDTPVRAWLRSLLLRHRPSPAA